MTTGSSKTTEDTIGKAVEVHRELDSGLPESLYEACLAFEVLERGLSFFPTLNYPALPSACC
jgi:GxxExxY protein